ncbi:MAG TPA: cobalt ECF transporter T component CbiQ [Armatimonadota bacterium]|nr:cobalt ECF transporter T component CbiQ [Armatimonadota bacterium]
MAVRRALAGLAEALAGELSSPARSESWLARIEPRAKVLGIVALIFGTSLLNDLLPLAALSVAAVVLALSGRTGLRRLAKVWLGVPLFSLAIILPAMTNLVTQGSPVAVICHIGPGAKLGPWSIPDTIAITSSGLVVAGRFLLRVFASVTLAFVLIATTDHSALLNGLRRLGMPRAFGMVLAMTQRYLALLLRTAEEIHLAKLSRTITAGSLRNEQRWVAAGIGSLFRRTHRLMQEVHDAMLSRGYDGDVRATCKSRLRISDGLWLACAIAVTAALILSDRLL